MIYKYYIFLVDCNLNSIFHEYACEIKLKFVQIVKNKNTPFNVDAWTHEHNKWFKLIWKCVKSQFH